MRAHRGRSSLVLLSIIWFSAACDEYVSSPAADAPPDATPHLLLMGEADGSAYRLSRGEQRQLPEGIVRTAGEIGVTGVFAFDGLRRFPAESRQWEDLAEGGEAYFRDVAVAMDAFIEAHADGETWRVDLRHPDGFVERGGTLTFHELWNGQNDCFVAGFSSLCGGTWAWWESTVQVQCAPSGEYGLLLYHNEQLSHETTFVLAPRVPPGTTPLLAQTAYPDDAYDSICKGADGKSVPCEGVEGEEERTISQKGCAMTSAAMMLGYHGVQTDPLSLNTWLTDNGGYTAGGGVKWGHVLDFAEESDTTLSFDWVAPATLRADICRYGPQIVQVKSRNVGDHFVLAIGMTDDESDFVIHDPAGGQERQLSFYSSGARSVRRFKGEERTDTIGIDLVVTFHSPGELLLTDPLDRRVGYDPSDGSTFAEIPGAMYDSIALSTVLADGSVVNDDEASRELYVHGAVDGDYTLDVTGIGQGTYILQITRYGAGTLSDGTAFTDIPIQPGEVHSYRFRFDRAAIGGADGIATSGAFAGGGQRADVDELVSYSRPAQRQTQLAAGTTTYSLMVFYDEGQDPASFTAELDRTEITGLFTPVPGGSDIVTIPLHPGRNVLLLSTSGTAGGRTATDRDRLTFVVK